MTNRRELLKLSPLGIAASIGHTALSQTPAPPTGGAVYDVRNFGATGDGKTVDSAAINRAIDAVAAAGGGTLVLPGGTYVCFSIHLRSLVDLYLSRGCTILAADSPKPGEATGYRGGVYDAAETQDQPNQRFQDFGHNTWRNSLFWGENIHDFAIFGPGLIHGKGLSDGFLKGQSTANEPNPFVGEQPGVGSKSIALKNCHNVALRDFSVLRGGMFTLLATGVDNLLIENLLVDTNRDGFDIDCCRNVRVQGCTVNSPWDDAICPKSSFALGYARPTENVTISNCFLTGTYKLGSVIAGTWEKHPADLILSRNGRIKCGTESNGGFRNITIANCVFEGSKGIAIECVDGGIAEDIAISNITMRDAIDAPLFLRLGRRNRGPSDTMRPGTLRRIAISNMACTDSAASTSSLFSGVPGNPIEDIKVSDCFFGHRGQPARVATGHHAVPGIAFPDFHAIKVPELEDGYPETLSFGATPSHGFFIRHLRNLEMAHVEIGPAKPDPRPAIWLDDVRRADFFAITAPPQPNFGLRGVTDLRILWSRAAPDTTLAKAESQIL